jgi:hypothetical protein
LTAKALLPTLLPGPTAIRGKHPILGLSKRRFTKPGQKITHRVFVDRHRLLRGFRLAPSDNLVHDGSLDVNLKVLKIDVLPLQAGKFAAAKPCDHA